MRFIIAFLAFLALFASPCFADLGPVTNLYLNARRGITVGTQALATNVHGTLRMSNDTVQVYINSLGWRNVTISGTNSDHATLDSLNYAASGHTGFLPSDGSVSMTSTTALVTGALTAGALSTTGTLASGAATITGTAGVTDLLTAGALSTTGTLASGNATITGTAGVTDLLTAGALSTTGTLASGAATVTGTAGVSGLLTAGALSTTGALAAGSADLGSTAEANAYTLNGSTLRSTSNFVINLTPAMSHATRVAALAAIPKDMGGYSVTVNLAAGVYTNAGGVELEGIFNAYQIILDGPDVTDAPTNTQTATLLLPTVADDTSLLGFIGCSASRGLVVSDIAFSNAVLGASNQSQSNNLAGLVFQNICGIATVTRCYFQSDTTNGGIGIVANQSIVSSAINYFRDQKYAVDARYGGYLMLNTTNAVASDLPPAYAGKATGGGVISELTIPQGAGFPTNNILLDGGGIYVPYAGKRLD